MALKMGTGCGGVDIVRGMQVFDTNDSGKVSQTEVHDAVLRIFTCVMCS